MEFEPLTPQFGALVQAKAATDIMSLNREEVVATYRSAGAILFRGFKVSEEQFGTFADQFTTELRVNGMRSRESVSSDGKTQTVNLGNNVIPFHSEMGYSPFRPSLLWFHCVVPPSWKGETTIVDGVALWSALPEDVREQFTTRKVLYSFTNVGAEFDFFGHPGPPTKEEIDSLETRGNVKVTTKADGGIDVEHTVHAAKRPRHIDQYAFCNSVIIRPGGGGSTTFEGGDPISDDLRLKLFETASSLALLHKWRAGDILMLDNLRVMHGRQAFKAGDPRRILVRMGEERF